VSPQRRSFHPVRMLPLAPLILALAAVAVLAPAACAGTVSVSYPSNPLTVEPGKKAVTGIRVSNPGKTGVDLTIAPSRISVGNNGVVTFESSPDPLLVDRVSIVPAVLHLGANANQRVRIVVDVPPNLQPNYYFLGVLVSPVRKSGAIKVVNRVGVVIPMDVPGPRGAKLTAVITGLPSVTWSASAPSGVVRVQSKGVSTVQFTAYTTIDGLGSHTVLDPETHLLPANLYRDVPVSWSTRIGLGWYTVRSKVVYHLSQVQTKVVTTSQRVYVIFWPWLFLPVAVIGLVVWLVWRGHRRKAAST
jgi:hypothetical protein